MSKCPAYCPPTCEFTINYCDYPIYCDDYDCTNPEPCVIMIPSDCVVYQGTSLQQYGVENGATATEIIIQLVNLVYPNCTTTTTTSTSTTTICQRPTGLSEFSFSNSIIVGGVGPGVEFTTSLGQACQALFDFYNISGSTLNGFGVETASMTVGNTIYNGGTGTDCTVVEDGYYICLDSPSPTQIYHTVGGVLTEILTCPPPTTTTTTTITPTTTTTTTTIAADATKCADCFPVLDNVTQNAIGLLSVGDLVSTADIPCVVGDYVIDWYLNSITNPIEFTSGVGSDPAISQLHPFTGAAARPSVAGNWIPVIRYVYLDGTKYTSTSVPGEAYSPDLATCLEPIVVENLNCTNGNTPTQTYTHSIEYAAVIQNPADATRTFRFDLGASVNYFAWNFYGYTVSDKIQFYYVSGVTQTLLGQYAIGFDINNFDVTGPVKKLPLSTFKEVFDLSTIPFVTGDYLSIVITSSYADPTNRNTDWRFDCKCLETFDCSNYPPAEIDPCSVAISYNSVTCTHDISYSFTSFPDCSNDRCIYLLEGGASGVYVTQYPSSFNLNTSYQLPYGQYCQFHQDGYNYCVNSSLKTLSKTGNIYTIDFTDGAEYLSWKNEYLTKYAILNTGYDPSTTNINHYRFILIKYIIDAGLLGCGDNESYKDIAFHITSPVTFDDINFTMQINVVNTVNNMPPLCGASCTSAINQGISYVANALLEPDFASISSTVRPYEFISISYTISVVNITTGTASIGYQHYLPYTISNYVCSAETNCVRDFGNITVAEYYTYYHVVFITDLNDALNNFKVSSVIDSNGCLITNPANYITLYEIANGVVTTPVGGCS